jgi:hypothetical protein
MEILILVVLLLIMLLLGQISDTLKEQNKGEPIEGIAEMSLFEIPEYISIVDVDGDFLSVKTSLINYITCELKTRWFVVCSRTLHYS